ncbi:MAG TPA: FtsX-like permease family protein [Actinocrinis sp.]|uniref:FtsX-like permease family protein n=1 Tax=Actinocrinis sp. TaxID=1920516 RepID=UPI002DDD7F44|nr:FtsX-like permease family protein [Actinocrinis sp.]HEV3174069.1 FtsX-like permease family protein [Actinocrinis sp.]
MYRLGLRLTLRSGREALTRLLVTMAAVAAGVTVLLCVLAEFHGFQYTNSQPSWQSTQPMAAAGGSNSNTELWSYTADVFEGRSIQRLDVAALGPDAPVPPGISRLPGPGEYYASPALTALIDSTPRDELGDRFPGSEIGTIGDKALTGPDDLVVFVGYQPSQLQNLPFTIRVDRIAAGPQTSVWTNYFRYAFAVGAVAFVFPILILIGSATRLAAARREERYAALRLVGATNRQINVIASVDATVSALFGAVLGIGLFELVRPVLADHSPTGARYFAYAVTPTAAGYLAMLIGVPLASAIAALISLRRVRISPLGVSRRQTPPAPGIGRISVLVLGIALFMLGIVTTSPENIGAGTYPGLLLILIGLVVAGPWLTAQAARLTAALASGPAPLLAARRLADNPRAAFRSVSGLVLAVFLGSMLAGLMPTVNRTTATPNAQALSDVLIDTFTPSDVCGNEVNCGGGGGGPNTTGDIAGLPPATSTALVHGLQAIQGAAVVPIYSPPQIAVQPGKGGPPRAPGGGGSAQQGGNVSSVPPPTEDGPDQQANSVVGCAALAQIPALGTCAPGRTAVQADTSNLTTDNPLYSTRPIVTSSSSSASNDFSALDLQAVLVKVNDPATLERVRTYLVTHTPMSLSGLAPRTFGEEVVVRETVSTVIDRIMNAAVLLTLLVAGASLAVAVGGGLVERKRPFTLLRLSGTSPLVLYRVVALEAVLPLAAATILAAGTGYGLAVLAAVKIAPSGTPVPTPGGAYYVTMGVGLVVSLLVIASTLPFLGRITRTQNARFE